MRKSFFILLYIFAYSTGLYCYNIKSLTAENGLSNNNVISITQDRDGFMWICTKDGLNRFDGNKFQIFRHSENDPNSICSNVLNYVFPDPKEDVVWIASEKNGLDAYNYKTHKFIHYRHNPNDTSSLTSDGITHISADNEGNIWLATYSTGIEMIDRKTGKITHFNQSNIKGLVSNYNWYVIHTNAGMLYVGHVVDGLSIIDLKKRTAVNFRNISGNPVSLCDNTVTCLFEDSRKRIWVGTRNGLALFNPETLKFINFRNKFGVIGSLSGNFIKSFVETPDHKLWIGTEGNGISILDLNTLQAEINPDKVFFERIGESNTDDGLSGGSVQALFQDSYGNFWAGGFISGVNFISNRKEIFQKINYLPFKGNQNSLDHTSVVGLCSDDDNKIWVANVFGGVALYDHENKIKSIRNISSPEMPLHARSVCMDKQNNLWIGSTEGKLYQFNKKSQKLSNVPLSPASNTSIFYLFCDSKNRIWIGTDGGIYVYDIATSQIRHYSTQNSELNDNNIRTFCEDYNGNIWVGSLIGALQVFDVNFTLVNDIGRNFDFYAVNHVYKDSQNRMWIATQNDLFMFSSANAKVYKRYGKKDGFAENNFSAISEGKNPDEFWVSSINGISKIDIKNNKVLNYFISDGIAAGDYEKSTVAKTKTGEIYFGGQHGITFFDQHSTDGDIEFLKPQITSFMVVDKSKEFITDFHNIPFQDVTELNYTQNSLQINFNVLDYSLNNKVEFMYQMSGLDDSWYFIGKEKQLTFRNLRHGKYVFSLKARIQNKDWNDQEAKITIIIHPPFWLTWWAKLIYFVLAVFLTISIVRFYKNRLKLENSLILEKRNHEQEQALNEEKMRFFTNIAHELRTPMTLIIGPLEDIVADKSLDQKLLTKINSIQRVANRLLDLVNQILEFRKTETNNRILKVKKANLISHIYEIGLRYKELYLKKTIDFRIILPQKPIEIFFDQEIISLILDNLITNAFKYTNEGRIELIVRETVESNVEYVEVSVRDTGIGLSEEELERVFNRYYQAKNRPNQVAGTGIGLSLVKNLVDLHEADISVNSEINKGTTFTVRFLRNNSYPNAIHLETTDKITDDYHEPETDQKPLVLVVEDNEEIVEYICDCLEENYDLLTAINGKAGYDLACEKTPDIIISDIMMPVMDGMEFCRHIKQNVLTSHIPVILLTAKTSVQDKADGYDAGADSYMTKPFSGNLLKSRVKNLLQTRPKLNEAATAFKNKKQLLHDSASQLDKDFIEKVTNIIETHIELEDLSVSQIASMMNMSHSSLYRKIKALTDLTTNEFIRKVRMKLAEQLLLTGKYTINEIMYRVGMNSAGHFRQSFKDEFGVTPTEYLQKLKE